MVSVWSSCVISNHSAFISYYSCLIHVSLYVDHHYLEPFELEIREISAQPDLLDRITLPHFRPHFDIPDELPERSRITEIVNLDPIVDSSDVPESPDVSLKK